MAQGLSLTPMPKAPPAARGVQKPQLGQGININRVESFLSLVGGGVLLTFAWRKRGFLGAASALLGGELLRRGLSRHSFLYQGLHVTTVKQADERAFSSLVERTVTINRSPQELYDYWHSFEQLPTMMPTLKEVQVQSPTGTRWVVNAPGGLSISWMAEITGEETGKYIAWRTLPGAPIPQRGSIHFAPAPGERGTEVKVVLQYTLPGGKAGDAVTTIFGVSPAQRIRESLRQFKAIMEAGETPKV